MKEANRYFWLGMVAACLFTAVFMNMTSLEAISRSVLLRKLPRELRLGVDLGILSMKEIRRRRLNTPISRAGFGKKLQRTLHLLGIPKMTTLAQLKDSGIFNPAPRRKAISRKHALEGVARAAIYMADLNLLDMGAHRAASFRDYTIPEKYQRVMGWLRERSVVRGYPGGSFKARRAITLKETIYFLYRLYEAVAGTRMHKTTGTSLLFVDLPLEHPVINDLRLLGKAGAFRFLRLRPSFDGNAPVVWSDVVLMLKGVLDKQGGNAKGFFPRPTSKSFAQRKHVALALSQYFKRTRVRKSATATSVSFKDVYPNSQLSGCLNQLASFRIHLGYPNGYFRPNERISWFEWIGVLKASLESADVIRPPLDTSKYATKADFERFAALIQAKRMRIRRILNREFERK